MSLIKGKNSGPMCALVGHLALAAKVKTCCHPPAQSMHYAYTAFNAVLILNQASAADHLKLLGKQQHTYNGQGDETGEGMAGQGRAGQGRAGQGRARPH